MEPDFSGWATKANIKCSDGRTIAPDAFAHQNKITVPLVWAHNHKDPTNVLGHAVLENRGSDGVYMYGYFNDTAKAQHSKELVKHKDVDSLSIWANQLKETAKRVTHGMIREVSLVLAGANPEAKIDNVVIAHADGFEEELDDTVVIQMGLHLEHEIPSEDQIAEHAESAKQSFGEIYDSLTEEQNALFHYFIAKALGEQLEAGDGATEDGTAEHSDENDQNDDGAAGADATDTEGEDLEHQEGNQDMSRRNLFDNGGAGATGQKDPAGTGGTLSHSDVADFWSDLAENGGTFKRAIKQFALAHGINDMEEILFPDARAVDNEPEWIKRQTEWVAGVLSGVTSRPFTRIKSRYADLTQDDARAKGYIKGTMKKEQFFGLTQRKTGPATVYKKQKLDRDDILDVNDFNMVDWMWGEMNLMIREEIARAILIGDGREIDDEDKVKDPNLDPSNTDGIRSILNDNDFYVTRVVVSIPDEGESWEAVEDQVALAKRFYKGTGSPTFYTTAETHTRLLLSRDGFGRKVHTGGDASLQTSLKVREIVDVEVMEGYTLEHNGDDLEVIGIIVNLADYVVGTDRGGELTKFDDFDIDFNQYKYLIESRLSGALVKAKSAMVILKAAEGDTVAEPVTPSFNKDTGVVTIPSETGVVYKDASDDSTLTAGAQPALAAGESITVQAVPDATHFFSNDAEDSWTFTRPSA